MNKEEINKIEKKINLLNEYANYLEEKHNEAYKIDCLYADDLIPKNYEIEYKIKDYEYLKEVLEKLEEENIDITKKYFITENIYLSVFVWGKDLTFHFYIDDDSWLYDNFISSHSGINEWIQELIEQEYDLFSGNSSYNYAFGTCTLKDYRRIIENKKEKYYDKKKYSVEQVVKNIIELIKYFTDENNKIRNIIIDEINHKFSKMKKLIEDD